MMLLVQKNVKLLCAFSVGLCIAQIISIANEGNGALSTQRSVASLVLAIVVFIVALALTPLGGYHCKLICIGETTNENVSLEISDILSNRSAWYIDLERMKKTKDTLET